MDNLQLEARDIFFLESFNDVLKLERFYLDIHLYL